MAQTSGSDPTTPELSLATTVTYDTLDLYGKVEVVHPIRDVSKLFPPWICSGTIGLSIAPAHLALQLHAILSQAPE